MKVTFIVRKTTKREKIKAIVAIVIILGFIWFFMR